MKIRTGLILVIVLLASLWPVAQVQASHTDSFTFFIPWTADELADFFRLENQFVGTPGQEIVVDSVQFTIGISVLRDGTLIYYDQWEDGMEANILFPIQPNTEIWGDGDPANGAPPGNPGDVLSAGDVIILSDIVPVPRNQADFFFDGGDKVSSVGGAIAITLSAWPQPNGRILFADSWELYPVNRWERMYVSPIGENVSRPNGDPPGSTPGFGFTVTMLVVQAAHDGTTVDIDLNGDGSFDRQVQLNEGQQYVSVVDRPPNGLSVPVDAGARVQATERVQVLLFTKDPLSAYQARGYTLIPDGQWSNDYLAPRSSDGDFWLYNPNSSDLVVTVQTTAGSTDITIPAGTTGRYPLEPAPVLPTPSGVRFTSPDGRPFYGVAALDADAAQDWGYALLPTSYMTTQELVGWAPGNNNTPPNGDESRVYVTALADTEVFVDINGDGVAEGSVIVTPLEETDIAGFDDLTGARLYTENMVPFLGVWGQDQGAPPALPSIDVGNNIVPLQAPSIQKTYALIQEGFDCGTVSRPTIIRFELLAFNDSMNPIPDAIVTDVLPPELVYVPGSTTVNGSPVADINGQSPVESGLNLGTLDALQSASVQFDAEVVGVGEVINVGQLSPDADPAIADLTIPFRQASYQLTKTLVEPASGLVGPGQVITFDVAVLNNGNVDLVQVPLRDDFDPNYLTSPTANPPIDAQTDGSITWNNVAPAGGLPPGQQVNVTLSFTVVDPLPAGVLNTINVILADGVVGSDDFVQAIICDEAIVPFAVPTPTPTPTRRPSGGGGGGGGGEEPTSTPRPQPTPLPTVPPVQAAPPTPAVALLPETGVGYANGQAPMWPLVLLPGLGLVLGWVVYRRRRRK